MSQKLFVVSLVLFSVLHCWKMSAQISESAVPFSISGGLAPMQNFKEMPAFDDQILKQESLSKLKSRSFAKMFNVAFHPFNSGVWDETGEGKVWRLGISSNQAFSLYFVFGEYQLAQGVRLFVYNADFTGMAGAFTTRNNNPGNVLTIAPIPGDKVIIELDIPSGVENFGRLLLTKVGHDYKNEFGREKIKLKAESGACNVDINCPEGQPWQYEKRAVCELVADGLLCSGTLVNNAENQKIPYLLTAYHCVNTEKVAEEAVFIFNYENVTCGGKNPTSPQSISGAELVATTPQKLDFSLLKLWEYPPLYYKPFFAGWDARNVEPLSGVCLHHPNGDVLKISIENHPLTTASFDTTTFDSLSHWEVAHWETGATEGGSSGSAIFNKQHRIFGTLTGGSSSCQNPVNDYFSKFSLAWDKYPLPENQLKHWLDPASRGITFAGGMDPYNVQLGICDTFWNVSKNERITLNNNGLRWGWISGQNSGRFSQFAEKFYSPSIIQIPGIFLYVAKNRFQNPFAFVTVKIWEGEAYPETELYSRRIDLRLLREGVVNFAGFDTILNVAGNFFAGYEVNYTNPLDTFAVYHAINRGVNGPSTMYIFDGEWKSIDAASSPAVYTSMSIGLVGCGGNIEVPRAKGITVFPNPCFTDAHVDLPEGVTITGVQCYDASGRTVPLPYQIFERKLVIYPVKLSDGIYLLKVQTTSVSLIAKFKVLRE